MPRRPSSICRSLVVAATLLAAACGDSDSQRAVADGGGAPDPVVDGIGPGDVDLCEDIRRRGVVDGAPSDDAEIAAAQRWRADRGLRSDASWVEQVTSTPMTTPEAASFAHPLTDDEVASLFARNERAVPSEAVDEYATRFPDTFAGTWIDNVAGGVFTVAFTEAVDERRRELEAALPPGTLIEVVEGKRSLADLEAIQEQIDASRLVGEVVDGTGIFVDVQVVSVLLRVVDAASVAALEEAVGPESMAGVCVEGRTAEELDPEGPQLEDGEGWRLLGDGTSGPVYATLVATDASGYEGLWDAAGFDEERPEADLDAEVVILFGPAVSGSCPQIRLDDVVIDVEDGVVHADFAHPGAPAACTDDANPHAYVVAVQRDALPPSPFTVQLFEDVACTGCEGTEPDEVTEVDLRPS